MWLLKKTKYPVITFIFLLCLALWGWDEKQTHTVLKEKGELSLLVGLTPIERNFFFDYPAAMSCLDKMIEKHSLISIDQVEQLSNQQKRQWNQLQKIPMWRGIVPLLLNRYTTGRFGPKEPLMEKIREGQVWRFFSPCLLHKDFFHFLFNMSWLLILGTQIEARISRSRLLLLMVLLGVFSNTAQYLMGGPFFLGFSGVVAGFAGFIWMRQKVAPSEGYPLPRSAALFLFYCILGMMFLEAILCILQMVLPFKIPFNIANTAHIVGGVTGLILGKASFFARRVKG